MKRISAPKPLIIFTGDAWNNNQNVPIKAIDGIVYPNGILNVDTIPLFLNTNTLKQVGTYCTNLAITPTVAKNTKLPLKAIGSAIEAVSITAK